MAAEAAAREQIDALLVQAGWHVCDAAAANIHAARGVAIREFPLPGHGFADYLLYLDGKAVGVIEAKKEGVTLSSVETQSAKYTNGLPAGLPAWRKPLPFSYQSTGVETRFTNGLDPEPRSRLVFAFHKPETLMRILDDALAFEDAKPLSTGNAPTPIAADVAAERRCPTFLARMAHMPPLIETGLWPAQGRAINNLEASPSRGNLLLRIAEYYDKMDAEAHALLPLIRIYWPA